MTVAALAGCGEPAALECGTDPSRCGPTGVCVGNYCALPDELCASGLRYHESAGPNAGTCTDTSETSGSDDAGTGTGTGGGPDGGGNQGVDKIQTLVLDGNIVVIDATDAQDDIKLPCAPGTGGKDVMFDVNLTTSRFYIDTFGTNYDVVVGVFSGACNSPTKTLLSSGCVGPGASCDGKTKQWSHTALLNAGAYCVVVDQPTATAGNQALGLVIRGVSAGPSRLATVGTSTGDTCPLNLYAPDNILCTVSNGPDYAWFFMACSGTYTATITTPSSWSGELETSTIDIGTLDCDDGDFGVEMPTGGRPSPFMILAHDLNAATCGNVTLNIQPD
jgi:hypothetical protein